MPEDRTAAREPAPPSPGLRSRLLRFGGLQVANAIAPLLVLPAVIGIIGPDGWVALANGLGIGAAAAVAVGLAWPITGPPRVAGAAVSTASSVFNEGLVMRAVAFVPTCVIAAFTVVWLAPQGVDPTLAVLMMIATALAGLNSNWFFVGRARAGGIVVYETLPKLAATVLTIPLVMWTDEPRFYPLLLGVASLWGILGSAWSVNRMRGLGAAVQPALRGLPRQIPLGAAGLLSTGSSSLAVSIATLSGTGLNHVAGFAAGVRLRSMAQAGIGAGTSAMQGWVAEQGRGVLLGRFPKALMLNAALGTAAAAGLAVLAPVMDTLIFGPEVHIDFATALLLGLACLLYSISASLSHHLLGPLERSRTIVTATATASVVSMPAIFYLGQQFGAWGAMAGVALSEAITVAIQGATAIRIYRARTRART